MKQMRFALITHAHLPFKSTTYTGGLRGQDTNELDRR